MCGAPLVAAPVQVREERKVVTVVFCDLVGFTARAERLDPEEVRGVLRPYHERVRSELERRGGTVEKFIGDAVMALFGAPTAHEDDPERAVRAALAIRDFAREEGLELRVGITTGEALVALRFWFQGDTASTAMHESAADALIDGAPASPAVARVLAFSAGTGCSRERSLAASRSVVRRWTCGVSRSPGASDPRADNGRVGQDRARGPDGRGRLTSSHGACLRGELTARCRRSEQPVDVRRQLRCPGVERSAARRAGGRSSLRRREHCPLRSCKPRHSDIHHRRLG
jgi:hypothetical protein